MESRSLRLAIPNGNLQQATVDLFARAGYKVAIGSRSYYPEIDDPEIECMLVRPQEQPRYIQDGLIDLGVTGHDWIVETDSDVVEVLNMVYSKVSRRSTRWVLVVPEGSKVHELRDLEGKRIATELVNITRAYLDQHGITARVEYSYGATEVKPPLLADAIVDATETGSSLRANNLRIVETIIESTPRLIASKAAWDDEWKHQKIEDIALMLRGAIAADGNVGLMMNLRRDDLEAVLTILPALDKPTISSLSDPDWVALNTIADESVVRDIVPRLKKAGAHGIVEYPLSKIIE